MVGRRHLGWKMRGNFEEPEEYEAQGGDDTERNICGEKKFVQRTALILFGVKGSERKV